MPKLISLARGALSRAFTSQSVSVADFAIGSNSIQEADSQDVLSAAEVCCLDIHIKSVLFPAEQTLNAPTSTAVMWSFVFLLLLLPLFNGIVEAQGSIQLFSDSTCNSPDRSFISLAAELCLETYQAAAVGFLSLPSCGSGYAVLVISDMTEYKRPSISPVSSGEIRTCLFFPSGYAIGSTAFECMDDTNTIPNVFSVTSQTSSSAVGSLTTSFPSHPSVTQSASTSTTVNFLQSSSPSPTPGTSPTPQPSSGQAIRYPPAIESPLASDWASVFLL